jgi:hypothetical protein
LVPPDDFTAFQAFRRAQGGGEQPPAEPKPTLPETPAETPAEPPPAPADKPEVKTAEESGTKEEKEQEEGIEQETEPAEKPEKPDKVQKRIDRLTREKYELKGRVEALERQLAAGKPAPEAEPKPAAISDVAPDGKPKVEDFENYEAFTEALADWKFDQREKVRAEETAKAEAKRAYEAKQAAWDGKLAGMRTKSEFEDYDERLADTRGPNGPGKLPPELDYAIFEAGPEVAYHLACNLPELNRIAKLPSFSAIRELGKIEAHLESLKTPVPDKKPMASAPPPKVTAAPKPVASVGGGTAGGTPSILDDKLAADFSAWKKVRRAQDKDR